MISSGRSSEKAHMAKYAFPEDCYTMMGDYLEFALTEARGHAFDRVHLAAQWAKMLKIALATPQTHVKHGAIDLRKAAHFLAGLGCAEFINTDVNTAREMFEHIRASDPALCNTVLTGVCRSAKGYAESITEGVPVTVTLISYDGEVIVENG